MSGDVRSVVDSHLRVRGIEGVRVADLSVYPNIPGGHTYAPAMVTGWHAADLILEDVRYGDQI